MTVIVIMTTSDVMATAFDYTFICVIAPADVVTKITLITIVTHYMRWDLYLLHVFLYSIQSEMRTPRDGTSKAPRATPGTGATRPWEMHRDAAWALAGCSPFICLSHFQLSRQVDVKGHFSGGSSSLFGWITITISWNKRKAKKKMIAID